MFTSVAGRVLPYLELRDSSIRFDQLTCKESMTIYAANLVIQALNSSYYSVLSKISNDVTALLSSKAKEVYIESSIFVSHL
jgi:hypothetical protein